jgi:hypothetical protein
MAAQPARDAILTPDRSRSVDKLKESKTMLWTIVVVLFILWALGMVTSYTMGGLVHLLLLLAVVAIVINLVRGRRSIV